ncbi:MAG: HD domain-containing protein [Actinobacteria bacterium]|nr:HD domain-containing protein [Actinomycetota bacterium]
MSLCATTEPGRHLEAVLVLPDPTDGLWDAVNSGWAETEFPELPALSMEQDPIHRHKDVLSHTITVVANTSPRLRLRLAALFHDIAKPKTRRLTGTKVTFHHHEAAGSRMTTTRLTALGFADDLVADVARLVELSGRFHGYAHGWTDSAVRRYARDAGPLLGDLNELVRCDCTTRHPHKVRGLQRQVDDLERRIRELAAADEERRHRPRWTAPRSWNSSTCRPAPRSVAPCACFAHSNRTTPISATTTRSKRSAAGGPPRPGSWAGRWCRPSSALDPGRPLALVPPGATGAVRRGRMRSDPAGAVAGRCGNRSAPGDDVQRVGSAGRRPALRRVRRLGGADHPAPTRRGGPPGSPKRRRVRPAAEAPRNLRARHPPRWACDAKPDAEGVAILVAPITPSRAPAARTSDRAAPTPPCAGCSRGPT